MKRFHVHLHVANIDKSIAFYSKLFAAEPARTEADYAKWMLQDPPLNFAISARGGPLGIDHLGFQAENEAELAELKGRAANADAPVLDEGQTTCCYARSDKHWVTDPQGVAWEQFHTLANIPVFHEAPRADGACCAGAATPAAALAAPASASSSTPAPAPARGKPVNVAVKASGSCC